MHNASQDLSLSPKESAQLQAGVNDSFSREEMDEPFRRSVLLNP
jgi:hypothetical protein